MAREFQRERQLELERERRERAEKAKIPKKMGEAEMAAAMSQEEREAVL